MDVFIFYFSLLSLLPLLSYQHQPGTINRSYGRVAWMHASEKDPTVSNCDGELTAAIQPFYLNVSRRR